MAQLEEAFAVRAGKIPLETRERFHAGDSSPYVLFARAVRGEDEGAGETRFAGSSGAS